MLWLVTGEPEVDVVVVSDEKGLKLSHEASIIAATERAEMKMIDFFIVRIVVDGAGYSITKRRFSHGRNAGGTTRLEQRLDSRGRGR